MPRSSKEATSRIGKQSIIGTITSSAFLCKTFVTSCDDTLPTLVSLSHRDFNEITTIRWQRSVKKGQGQMESQSTTQFRNVLKDRLSSISRVGQTRTTRQASECPRKTEVTERPFRGPFPIGHGTGHRPDTAADRCCLGHTAA